MPTYRQMPKSWLYCVLQKAVNISAGMFLNFPEGKRLKVTDLIHWYEV